MMLFKHRLKKCTGGYKLHDRRKKQQPNVIDDIKQFAKNDKELETLIQAVRIYSEDIGMELSIEKCAMLIMKSGKQQMAEGIELPNQERFRTLGKKETNNYLGIIEADTIKHAETKENF